MKNIGVTSAGDVYGINTMTGGDTSVNADTADKADLGALSVTSVAGRATGIFVSGTGSRASSSKILGLTDTGPVPVRF